MEVQFGPNSVDEPSLLYKLHRKLRVFDTSNSLPNRGYNLVASSSKYGIVFIASPDGTLSVYHLNQLIDKECEPLHLVLNLPEKPTHIAVSCDHELLAVTGGQLLCVYKVTNFQNQSSSPAVTIKYDVNPSTFVSALQWNPCVPDSIAIAFFDGTLLASQVSSGQVKKVQGRARCICWSPKGKQLVTGNSDGTLCQYKPDLTPAKLIPAPNLFEGAPVEVLAIYWISTFQFAVVYKNATKNSRPAVTVVNTPKAGQPSCISYEDICYSMGSNRPWYYYLHGLAQWNMIMSSSSNSMEIATLGSADGANWFQWCQNDEARPELPLTDKKIENYPLGLCIDTCAIHQLPWGENDILPHMPLLLVVSQSGLLTIFNVINLSKAAPQLCTPPQQFALPAGAMTTAIPGEIPQPTQPAHIPAPIVEPKPQPVQQLPPPPQPSPAFAPPVSQFSGVPASVFSKPPAFQQPQLSQGFSAASISQGAEQNQEVKPVINIPQPQAIPVQPKPPPAEPKPQPSQAQEVNAALKVEQERMNRMKVDQELRSMLVKEVNDFQMELYKFVVKSRETQIKLQRDLESIDINVGFQNMDTERLKKECSLDELRGALIELKLELVRACAVVAEARTHAEAKDLHQWSQADPLTTKRVTSVKKLAYYVQTQLEQAQRALDYKWNEMAARDPQYNKPGQRMIRPILDDVYQPLVKQQEILGRQQAVLRTLRNTLKECDVTPMFKSTTLLRSTPFRNKDPLSKLTKNILNMSIDPQANKDKQPLITPQKLDALRDMLSNHKPVKIKPVNVELRQHLAAMRLNYEREKASQPEPASVREQIPVRSEPMQMPIRSEPVKIIQPAPPAPVVKPNIVKLEAKPDLISKPMPISVPTFTPVNNLKPSVSGLATVARTLFTDEPKQDSPKPQPQMQPTVPKPQPIPQSLAFASTAAATVTANTRSVLKDMLQNKQANAAAKESKSDSSFMGQKICAPTAFAFSSTPNQSPTPSFTSKPISDINNMFNKFSPQTFAPEPKPQASIKPRSDETGEPEIPDSVKQLVQPKEEKALTNLFGLKTPLATSSQNVPDVLKSNFTPVKTEESKLKPAEQLPETSKENVPEKLLENVPQTKHKSSEGTKENAAKPFSLTGSNKPSIFASPSPIPEAFAIPSSDASKSAETKEEMPKMTEKPDSPTVANASSLFASANSIVPKPQSPVAVPTSPTFTTQPSIFGASTSTQPTPPIVESTSKESVPGTVTTASASNIFATAAVSQPAFNTTTVSGSIFTSTASTAPSVFGTSTQGSIFGTATATTTSSSTPSSVFETSTSTTQSVFSSIASAKPSIFSTPTPASPSSVFATTTASVFGSPPGASVFATASTPSTASTSSVFVTTTTAQSIFGAATTGTQSVFGGTATTTQSIFGATTPTTQASVFGSATTTTPSVFGTSTATTSASSIFGAAVSGQTSIFGTSPTTQSSVFGATTQTSVFGSPTSSTQASVFGASVQTTQASVFGTPPVTTAQSGSPFGGAEANLFASASISTTSASSPTSGGSIFGGSSGSIFGNGGGTNANVFGGKSSFGQSNPTAASIFGGAAASSFGQKPAANFWSGGSATGGSAFGASGFGQQATTQASSIFGGGTGGSFSAPSGGQAFGSPQQSVFGSPQQQTSPAFGNSPVFSAKPVFGQSPGGGGFGSSYGGFNKSPGGGFGAPAAFGGGATFGGAAFGNTSPSSVFSGAAAAAPTGFGSPTQSNATFESLATQNTLTFGNLAQQSGQPAPQAPTFNTSPSFTGWRG